MYVACRPLKLGTRQALPGEPVPEADGWQYSVLQAHLNLGWIKKEDDLKVSTVSTEVTIKPPPSHKKKKSKKSQEA